MKKLFIAFVAAACTLSSCSDDNTAEDASQDSITISSPEFPVSSEGGTTEIKVTSSGDWRISGACDWARASAVSGKNGDTVTITVDPNNTDTPRETTFKFFTGSAVAPLKIVTQSGNVLDLVSEAEVTLGKAKTSFIVKLYTNISELECEFSGDGAEWITYVGRTEAFGNVILNFEVTENKDFDGRSTTMTVSGMDLSLPVSIVQKQTDEILVDPESFELDLSEQTLSVDVSANVVYEVDIPVDWIQQVETRGLETTTLNFHVDPAQSSRSTTITITGAGITREVLILQKDPDAQEFNIPDEAFLKFLVDNGWVLSAGASACIVLEKGATATTLSYMGNYSGKIKSVEGIENFPNLTSISLSSNELTKVDISKLTKISSLILERNYYLSEINLGDNPINTWNPMGYYGTSYAESFTVISSRLTSLDLSLADGYGSYDDIVAVDVSGCPALQTLDCERDDNVKTLYLKEGQVIPNLTKSEVTQIVYK